MLPNSIQCKLVLKEENCNKNKDRTKFEHQHDVAYVRNCPQKYLTVTQVTWHDK